MRQRHPRFRGLLFLLLLVVQQENVVAVVYDGSAGKGLSPHSRHSSHGMLSTRAVWERLSRLPWLRKKRTILPDADDRKLYDSNEIYKREPGISIESPVTTTEVAENEGSHETSLEKDEEKDSKSVSVASILGFLKSMSRNPKIRLWAANGVQIGLIAYLAHAVWQSAAEVIDEYSKEIGGIDLAFSQPDEVARLMNMFEMDPARVQSLMQNPTKTSNELPSIPLLSLARKLLLSGMPLRQTDDGLASVESVMLSLTRNEAHLLEQCMWTPLHATTTDTAVRVAWNGVAGLEGVKVRLLDSVAQIRGSHAQAFSSLFDDAGASGGILLYGPPGCGKTMLIRALAAATRLPCLIVTPSVLLRKYVGESNRQVRCLFSLSSKLAPCVLCIDELDGLFRERNANEQEVSRELKTEFLQWWDGMLSGTNSRRRVLVIGATNRPFDVDPAVLRRLPQSYFIGLPDAAARSALLTQMLSSIPTEEDIDIQGIVARTEGYSPSDLRQVLQTAALSGPLREANLHPTRQTHRDLSASDMYRALEMVRPTPLNERYRAGLNSFAGLNSNSKSTPSGDQYRWETGWGNFYDAGTLHLDYETFDLLTDLAKEMDMLSDEDDDTDID